MKPFFFWAIYLGGINCGPCGLNPNNFFPTVKHICERSLWISHYQYSPPLINSNAYYSPLQYNIQRPFILLIHS